MIELGGRARDCAHVEDLRVLPLCCQKILRVEEIGKLQSGQVGPLVLYLALIDYVDLGYSSLVEFPDDGASDESGASGNGDPVISHGRMSPAAVVIGTTPWCSTTSPAQ